jgi:hypothetical protein
MSETHDIEPIQQSTIECWRINYGLDTRTPAEAANWWHASMQGCAPSGCVAALGVALDELERLRQICTNAHDQLLRGGDDNELLALLASGWKKRAGE